MAGWVGIKGAQRALEKVVRCYGDDVDRLCDIVRQVVPGRGVDRASEKEKALHKACGGKAGRGRCRFSLQRQSKSASESECDSDCRGGECWESSL